MSITTQQLDIDAAQAVLPALIDLLADAVHNGASVGFVLPLAEDELEAYWRGVLPAVARGEKVLLVAEHANRIVGTVQLALEPRANGVHRAEIQKLLVLQQVRRQGIGAALMQAAETAARNAGRSLLVLDTREGDSAERLYVRLGYQVAGVIPRYARSPDGRQFDGSTFMYKEL